MPTGCWVTSPRSAMIQPVYSTVFMRCPTRLSYAATRIAIPRVVSARGRRSIRVQHDSGLLGLWREIEASFSWTQRVVSDAGYFDWLDELPLEHRWTVGNGGRMLAVHASPGRDDGEGVHPNQAAQDVRRLLDGYDADLVFVGHTHQVVDRVVGGVRVVNPGSISNHLGPDVSAKYAIVTSEAAGYDIEFRRVDYDVQAAIDALHRVRHPGRDYISRFFRGDVAPPW